VFVVEVDSGMRLGGQGECLAAPEQYSLPWQNCSSPSRMSLAPFLVCVDFFHLTWPP